MMRLLLLMLVNLEKLHSHSEATELGRVTARVFNAMYFKNVVFMGKNR